MNVKKTIVGIVCVAVAPFLLAQPTEAGPVKWAVNKASTVAHRAGHQIDKNLVQPSRRVIVRHTRG
jgi:hypothetical protein